jgi:hypothetical protein
MSRELVSIWQYRCNGVVDGTSLGIRQCPNTTNDPEMDEWLTAIIKEDPPWLSNFTGPAREQALEHHFCSSEHAESWRFEFLDFLRQPPEAPNGA